MSNFNIFIGYINIYHNVNILLQFLIYYMIFQCECASKLPSVLDK